jgi:hypothetical protein
LEGAVRHGISDWDIAIPIEEADSVVFEVPLHVGWADIQNASLNVVVPDFVSIERCHGDGTKALVRPFLVDQDAQRILWLKD